MPPEYILEGTLSKEYDVYSFGVTLLETISGLCKAEPARHHASVTWVSNLHISNFYLRNVQNLFSKNNGGQHGFTSGMENGTFKMTHKLFRKINCLDCFGL